MAAKELLPVLGGSSAVWVTCLVFFQAALLLGYFYAHWMARGGVGRRWVHLGLLGAGVLAVAGTACWPLRTVGDAGHPVGTIFRTLGMAIGLPFLLLGASSPLLQVWMARVEGRGVRFGLFALSNVGSLLGLAAYPLLIEPHVTLRGQRLGWAAGFVTYAGLIGWIASRDGVWVEGSGRQADLGDDETVAKVGHPDSLDKDEVAHDTTLSFAQNGAPGELEAPGVSGSWVRAMWFLLPMGAAMQLAAVTSHLTVNIAAIPLLWVLPLGMYLVSFIVAFEGPGLYRRGIVVRTMVVMMAGLGYALTKTDMSLPISVGIPFFLVELCAACLFCHAEVYRLRPLGSGETTTFYLMVAGGGVAGTFLVGIVSPLVFSANYDLGIAFLFTAVLALLLTWNDGWGQRLLWVVGSGLLAALVVMLHVAYRRQVLEVERNFYGTLRVTQKNSPAGPVRMLTNGTIQHGTQIFPWQQPGLERVPTTYYAEDSGVGLAIKRCCVGWGRHVGVIGLGVGTLAAYGRAGDRFRFYEINALVRPVAERWFTYLKDSGAEVTFAEGDGRASLRREAAQGFDVLVVDAFSGDAIPLHLLTVEAMREYRRHLAPDGVIAFHVSNQYLNLSPEIAVLAGASGMEARVFDSGADAAKGEYRATWVLVSGDPRYFEGEGMVGRSARIAQVQGVTAWTDDHSSLLPLVLWNGQQ